MLFKILAFALLLGPLIAIHEFGHFWVARRLGIKVLTFSIGFGPIILKRNGKDGVQYQWAAIPLGGYVKMADEREGEVAPQDLDKAFNRQPAWKKLLVVAAGPLINLLFALVVCIALYLPLEHMANSRIANIVPSSPAALAGMQNDDKVLSVNQKPVSTLEDLHLQLVSHMGETGHLPIVVERNGQPVALNIAITQYMKHAGQDPLQQLGFELWRPQLKPIIGALKPDGAAATQGLKTGDVIVSINGQVLSSWDDLKKIVAPLPNQFVDLVSARNGQQTSTHFMVGHVKNSSGVEEGALGVGAYIPKDLVVPEKYQTTVHNSLLTAVEKGFDKTVQLSKVTLVSIGKLVTGQISLDNLSGPISIAQVASQSAHSGVLTFLQTMAFLSISLGIMNLLPIPVLDGGHIVYYSIEAILRKPIPEAVQLWGVKIGTVLLLAVMATAILNDILKLFG